MAKTNSKRILKWIVTLLVLVAAGVGGYRYYQQRQNQPPSYVTASLVRGELTQLVTATGQLNPVTNVTVGSQISGTIAQLFADFNSAVTNNQVVAQIDPATYRANVQLGSADVANARAMLELAQINARRSQELFGAKLIPQSDYDTAVANLHQAEAVLMNKQATLDRAKVDLERCTILAPVDGVVISRNVDVGQTVAASLSAPTLFVIANDLTKMQIDANVAEADVGGVEVGQDVDFTVDAFPNRTFHGQVVQVRNAPITVQNVVTYDTVISVGNPDKKLKPGMTANVSVIIARRDNALKVPNAGLRFRPPEPATNAAPRSAMTGSRPGGGGPGSRPKGERRSARTVYLLKDNAPQPVQIKTGISDGVFTEVLEGLNENDKVVTAAIVKNAGSATQATNPFGGGGPGGMRRF